MRKWLFFLLKRLVSVLLVWENVNHREPRGSESLMLPELMSETRLTLPHKVGVRVCVQVCVITTIGCVQMFYVIMHAETV